jgi:hypothetical protein
MALTFHEISSIVKQITYKDWEFRVIEKGDGFLLQVRFMAPDSDKPGSEPVLQGCRKWYVSSHATKNEVVRTAFKAVMAAVEHEACEAFLYKYVAIFNPHFDPDTVVSAINFDEITTQAREAQIL